MRARYYDSKDLVFPHGDAISSANLGIIINVQHASFRMSDDAVGAGSVTLTAQHHLIPAR